MLWIWGVEFILGVSGHGPIKISTLPSSGCARVCAQGVCVCVFIKCFELCARQNGEIQWISLKKCLFVHSSRIYFIYFAAVHTCACRNVAQGHLGHLHSSDLGHSQQAECSHVFFQESPHRRRTFTWSNNWGGEYKEGSKFVPLENCFRRINLLLLLSLA